MCVCVCVFVCVCVCVCAHAIRREYCIAVLKYKIDEIDEMTYLGGKLEL